MRYELKHDKLAVQIYEMVSVEAKARRKAENVYHLYEEIGATRFFTEEELAYLAQFLPVLRPNEHLLSLIGESKKKLHLTRREEEEKERARLEREMELVKRVKARQKRISAIIVIAGIITGILLLFALRQSRRATENQRVTEEIRQNLERKDTLSEGLKKELAGIISSMGKSNPDEAAEYVAGLNRKFPSIYVDARDWSLYETVELNEQIWLAENLEYDPGKESWVYNNDLQYKEKFGRLYTWEAARKACTPGWRVPSALEWRQLVVQFSGENFDGSKENPSQKAAYDALIAEGYSNFAALLGGKRYTSGIFGDMGLNGEYWSSTAVDTVASDAWLFSFNGELRELNPYHYSKSLGISCRCVKE